jgi:SRSO17 transposase
VRATARRDKAAAGEIEFQTKPEIALEQIQQAVTGGVDRGVVLADAAYGMNTDFRQALTELKLEYVAGVQAKFLTTGAFTDCNPPPSRILRSALPNVSRSGRANAFVRA